MAILIKKQGESGPDALKRCYPELVASRAVLYKQFGDVTIPYAVHKNASDARSLMEAVYTQLASGK
jgi:hypothetical protein|tara:strand:- start:4439 stop:4636 length:198 start_codon:yes stop_codon:yes gene_type:complete